jgi:hypothetical protein
MRKLALALAAATALVLSAPSFVTPASAAPAGDQIELSAARKKVTVIKSRRGVVKKTVIKRGAGWNRRHAMKRGAGWNRRHATKRVVIKKRPGGTVVKKTVIRR